MAIVLVYTSKSAIISPQTLGVLLQILVVFPNNVPLRNKVRCCLVLFIYLFLLLLFYASAQANSIHLINLQVTSFLHRMVDILGASILPFLPMALKQLLMDSEVRNYLFEFCSVLFGWFM